MRFLFCTSPARAARAAQSGFTLIELLVVLAIIAAVAGVGVQVFTGVTEDSERALARAEMDNIASAIQRFHRDTGYWPKQGLFDVPAYDNPADFSQLRVAPENAGNPILEWDTASGTGWHGPYLRELDAVTVSIGEDFATNTTGDTSVSTLKSGDAELVAAIADPFQHNDDDSDAVKDNDDSDDFYFIWRTLNAVQDPTVLPQAKHQLEPFGRPYLYFIDTGAEAVITGCKVPCLVSSGPDGVYEEGNDDDIVVNIAGHQ